MRNAEKDLGRFFADEPPGMKTNSIRWFQKQVMKRALTLPRDDVDAPRPLLVRANLPDNWRPVSGYGDIESLTRKVCRLYGAEDKIDFRGEVHEHNLTGPFADALEAFLLKHL
ncbi:MAG: hypothetical protein ABIF82_05085 [Planctomycetota bacterium]